MDGPLKARPQLVSGTASTHVARSSFSPASGMHRETTALDERAASHFPPSPTCSQATGRGNATIYDTMRESAKAVTTTLHAPHRRVFSDHLRLCCAARGRHSERAACHPQRCACIQDCEGACLERSRGNFGISGLCPRCGADIEI
jgi:hypothetical protein